MDVECHEALARSTPSELESDEEGEESEGEGEGESEDEDDVASIEEVIQELLEEHPALIITAAMVLGAFFYPFMKSVLLLIAALAPPASPELTGMSATLELSS